MNKFGIVLTQLSFYILRVTSFPVLETGSTSRGLKENDKNQGDHSIKELLYRLDDKLEGKFDVMDNKINNVNHNVEMLDTKMEQKFEAFSSKETHIDHKLDMLETKINQKVDDMHMKSEQTFGFLRSMIDRSRSESTWPMSSFWYWLLGLDVVLTVVCRLL